MSKIQFSEKSWHYKIAKFDTHRRDIPNSLCPYVRLIVKNILKMIAIALAGIFVVCLFSVGIYGVYMCITSYFSYFINGMTEEIPFGEGILISFILLGILTGMISTRRGEEKEAIRRGELLPNPKKQPGLISLYLTALHDRVCPHIDFVDACL